MPLIITEKDISWLETKENIKITIPLQSRIDAKTSILTTSQYLKISSPPWLWECFLASSINVQSSHAIVEGNRVTFELKKIIPELWNNLEDAKKGNESFRKEQRNKAFEEHKRSLENIQETNASKKHEIYRASVRKQMMLDDRERELIAKEKKAESDKMAAELERIRKQQQRANEIALKRKQLRQKADEIPSTRKSGHITVTFTPRVFPTAARESQEAEEKEWLEKQAAAAVSVELDSKDLSPQERNPEWLKQKAKSLFKKEDYRGAVNAYNLAIRICPNMYSLYLGRSACHLQLRNLHKCIEDSSKALELLNPPVPSNANDRFEAHKIRGKAFHEMDLPVEGLMDLDAALKINPSDCDLKVEAEKLRKFIEATDNYKDIE